MLFACAALPVSPFAFAAGRAPLKHIVRFAPCSATPQAVAAIPKADHERCTSVFRASGFKADE